MVDRKQQVFRVGILVFAMGVLLSLGGCASIVKQGSQSLQLNTDPQGAKVTIVDMKKGGTVMNAETPCVATLQRGNGYFSSAKYKIVFEKEGYDRREILLDGNANGWYVGGNILFGGLIGWLIVDPLTGAMWTLEPEAVTERLSKSIATRSAGGDMKVVFSERSNLPPEVREKIKSVQQTE